MIIIIILIVIIIIMSSIIIIRVLGLPVSGCRWQWLFQDLQGALKGMGGRADWQCGVGGIGGESLKFPVSHTHPPQPRRVQTAIIMRKENEAVNKKPYPKALNPHKQRLPPNRHNGSSGREFRLLTAF